jgi:hypothetical protein
MLYPRALRLCLHVCACVHICVCVCMTQMGNPASFIPSMNFVGLQDMVTKPETLNPKP